MIAIFILSVFWWIRIRGLWKLPDGKDWLGLVMMDGTLLSKSLIQFSVDGLGCVPSLCLDWGQTMVRVLKISQFSSVLGCVWLCDPMDCSKPGLPVHHQFLEFTQIHVHWVSDTISSSVIPSPFAFNLSHHHSLFKWVSSSHQVARVLEFQLQHQYFQWTFRTDFL